MRSCSGLWGAIFCLLVAGGCTVEPADETDETDETNETETDETDTEANCEVVLELTANGATSATVDAGSTVVLEALARNVTEQGLGLTMIDQCPSGQAQFSGLGSFDYYETCSAGACETSGDTYTQAVSAGGQMRVSAEVSLAATSPAMPQCRRARTRSPSPCP